MSLLRPFRLMTSSGRSGPAFPSSALQAERYPGTRFGADPVYKVDRCGVSRRGSLREKDEIMVTPALGIDVSKDRLDVEIAACRQAALQIFCQFARRLAPADGLA